MVDVIRIPSAPMILNPMVSFVPVRPDTQTLLLALVSHAQVWKSTGLPGAQALRDV